MNGARIIAAELVAEGAFVPPAPPNAARFADLPAFCRVTALASRAGDTDVKIEVWLPAAEKWTGEFQPAASGFAGGTIGYREMRTNRRPRERHRQHQSRTRRRRSVEGWPT